MIPGNFHPYMNIPIGLKRNILRALLNVEKEHLIYPDEKRRILRIIKGEPDVVRSPKKFKGYLPFDIHSHPPGEITPSGNDIGYWAQEGIPDATVVSRMGMRRNPFYFRMASPEVGRFVDYADKLARLLQKNRYRLGEGEFTTGLAGGAFGDTYLPYARFEIKPLREHPLLGDWLRLLRKGEF